MLDGRDPRTVLAEELSRIEAALDETPIAMASGVEVAITISGAKIAIGECARDDEIIVARPKPKEEKTNE